MKSVVLARNVPLLLVCLLMLSGCATSGVMQGRSAGQPVKLHYHHSFWSQNGVINTVMPNGETFSGKFVIGQSDSTGVAVGKSGDPLVLDSSGNTSQASAVLMGNKGDSMHCKFQLAHSADGIEGGGVGRCKLSTGQIIDVTF